MATTDHPPTIILPTTKASAEISDSIRAVLYSYTFTLAQKNRDAKRPEERHELIEVPPARLDSLLEEMGKNAMQRIQMLAINHQLDAKPTDWQPHVDDLMSKVGHEDWVGAIRVLARMTTQATFRLEEASADIENWKRRYDELLDQMARSSSATLRFTRTCGCTVNAGEACPHFVSAAHGSTPEAPR